jgi:hypothetical protein
MVNDRLTILKPPSTKFSKTRKFTIAESITPSSNKYADSVLKRRDGKRPQSFQFGCKDAKRNRRRITLIEEMILRKKEIPPVGKYNLDCNVSKPYMSKRF